jgi:predicted NAD/FAD-binding protein
MHGNFAPRRKIAVVGTGISGMAAAWLLSQRHEVSVYESNNRIGGHSNTVFPPCPNGRVPVDTGFIVYNELTYPNLTALFHHLNVPTRPSNMSFAVSLDNGNIEYSGTHLSGLLAQKRNLVRGRFWSMLFDIGRFYREAPRDLAGLEEVHTTLGDYLESNAYGTAFRQDHLLPMASAIWSAPPEVILDYPAASFIRFQNSHGLLRLRNRPPWRTVVGGSKTYVERLTAAFANSIRLSTAATALRRDEAGVEVRDSRGNIETFDDVVLACHADEALRLLDDPSGEEQRLLGAFGYGRNTAVLHSDPSFMPRRRAVWSSWNHLGSADNADGLPTVTYWMNALQSIPLATPFFVTLNPGRTPRHVWHTETYEHPLFDSAAISAQQTLWSIQGRRNTWYCGAYFGAGFHEDGLQAGLAVAEALGGRRRPWDVAEESGRIWLPDRAAVRQLSL